MNFLNKYSILAMLCIYICIPISAATEGSVRLTGGSDPAIGNVEILYNGVWGAVCSTGWNDNAGRVVCAQLGYDPYDDYLSTRPGGRLV